MGEKWARFAVRHRDEVVDGLLAVALLVLTLPPLFVGYDRLWPELPLWIPRAAAVAGSLVMLVRRRWVWPTLVVTAGCLALTGEVLPLSVASYSMSAHATVRRWRPIAVMMTLVYLLIRYASPHLEGMWSSGAVFDGAVRGVIFVYLPAIMGDWVRGSRVMIRSLEEAVRIREEHAALQERRRIAGELHDTVTHAVTTMVLNAGVMQDAEDPAELPKLAKNIEDQGIRALTELRELLTVLHRQDVPPSAKGIDAIPQLVRDFNATGLEVDVQLENPPSPLSRRVEHAVYRVVQEGLNNVRKHAPSARVRVATRVFGKVMTVSVINNAGSDVERRRQLAPVKSGYGLEGLKERVRLVGGRLTSGPSADGGYAVTAQIPCLPPDESP